MKNIENYWYKMDMHFEEDNTYATRADVIMCYNLFLARSPESEIIIEEHLQGRMTPVELAFKFAKSIEYQYRFLDSLSIGKCFNPLHLAKNIPSTDRVQSYLFHYNLLNDKFRIDILKNLLLYDQILYSDKHTSEYTIRITTAKAAVNEGELIITFEMDGKTLYCLGFTFCPGLIFGMQGSAILISRLQGFHCGQEAIRQAAVEWGGNEPRLILLSCLLSIAAHMNIDAIVGITGTSQVSYDEDSHETFMKSYDEFFIRHGFVAAGEKFFILRFPFEAGSTAAASAAHRRRAAKRRAFRANFADRIRGILEGWS